MVISYIKSDTKLNYKNDLKIKPTMLYNTCDNSFNIYKETHGDLILVPYYYNKENPIINKKVVDINIHSNIILRQGDQEECYNNIINSCKSDVFYSGIINLTTASGKTVLSLKIIETLKLKTLIIVNTNQLLTQWADKINQFCPDTKIGYIQGKNIDIENKDIVIGMVQTLSNEKVVMEQLKSFGLTIIDEVHSIPTKVFSNIFFKITSKYQFGLTATIDRRDKLDVVFKYFLGDTIYSNINESNLKQQTLINVYNVNFNIGEIKYIKFRGETKINMASTMNQLSTCDARNDFIADILMKLALDPERKVLCMSDRIGSLQYIHNKLQEHSGLFIGKMKQVELETTKNKQILLATYPMVIQGFDYPEINTLVFCTPRSNIEQAIGRIYRKEHTVTPMIIDIVDNNTYIYINQYKKRNSIYKTKIDSAIIKKFNLYTDEHDS